MKIRVGDLIEERYRIERRLDSRSAAVFQAFDTGAERHVVIKFLALDASKPAARARFQRELQIVANLRDPHTVRLLGYGAHDDVPFTLFEYLPGEDLEALIQRGPWPPAIARRVSLQLLSALLEAHQAGIIHRNVCPENIRVFEHLTQMWNVKLLDFGLGRPTDPGGDDVALTATGEVLGIPRYAAPEAVRGEPLTAASDIYSLGIIALEIILGRDALDGAGHAPGPAAVHAALNRVQPPLAAVLRRMLAPDPERRYASAEAVIAALQSAPGRVEPAETPPTPDVDRRREDRRLHVLGFAVGAAIIAAVIWYGEPPPKPRSTIERSAGGLALVKHAAPPTAEPPVDAPREPLAAPPVIVVSGCGVEPPFAGIGRLAVETGPLSEYTWATYVPPGYDPSKPHALVLLVHGLSQSADDLLRLGGFVDLAKQHNFVVVAPSDASALPWKTAEDQATIRMVVASTKEQLCIDDQRVFAVGHSQGGHILETLMCEPWIRGLAFHSHRGSATARRCIDRQLPLMLLNPMKSPHVPFEGGANCTGQHKEPVRAVEWSQQKRNGCTGKPKVVFEDPSGRCFRWRCDVPLVSCHVEGGHAWPGVRPTFDHCAGPDPAPFPAADRIWAFFSEIE